MNSGSKSLSAAKSLPGVETLNSVKRLSTAVKSLSATVKCLSLSLSLRLRRKSLGCCEISIKEGGVSECPDIIAVIIWGAVKEGSLDDATGA